MHGRRSTRRLFNGTLKFKWLRRLRLVSLPTSSISRACKTINDRRPALAALHRVDAMGLGCSRIPSCAICQQPSSSPSSMLEQFSLQFANEIGRRCKLPPRRRPNVFSVWCNERTSHIFTGKWHIICSGCGVCTVASFKETEKESFFSVFVRRTRPYISYAYIGRARARAGMHFIVIFAYFFRVRVFGATYILCLLYSGARAPVRTQCEMVKRRRNA